MSSEVVVLVLCIVVLLGLQLSWEQALAVKSKGGFQRNAARTRLESNDRKQRRKPDWIAEDILRLKALHPKSAGVRQIAASFNRIQAGKANASNARVWRVSKSYVANLLRSRQLEVQRIRESIRQRQPGISAICHTWGIDITGKKDTNGQLHQILGIIDHGSRKLIALIVTSKHSHLLVQHVLTA